jgi:hypothetical protein
MITLITVTMPVVERYLNFFVESAKKLSLISEFIICRADMPPDFEKINGNIKEVGSKYHKERSGLDMSHDHALALHSVLDIPPKNDLILISDPDIFFYTDVSSFYYELMQKYDLNIIGVARNNPQMYVQGYFPAIFNMLVRRSELPKEFIKVEIGDKEYVDKFFAFDLKWREQPLEKPGHYDTGCLLEMWGRKNNWKWLSFLTGDVHNYSTQFMTAQPKIKDRLERKKLLYHQSMSWPDDAFKEYKENYDRFI